MDVTYDDLYLWLSVREFFTINHHLTVTKIKKKIREADDRSVKFCRIRRGKNFNFYYFEILRILQFFSQVVL